MYNQILKNLFRDGRKLAEKAEQSTNYTELPFSNAPRDKKVRKGKVGTADAAIMCPLVHPPLYINLLRQK